MDEKLLEISNLRTYFFTEAGVVKALDGMSLEVYKGQAVGLVGESGSGKSVTAQSVLRIVPRPGRIVDGSVKFEGEELLNLVLSYPIHSAKKAKQVLCRHRHSSKLSDFVRDAEEARWQEHVEHTDVHHGVIERFVWGLQLKN